MRIPGEPRWLAEQTTTSCEGDDPTSWTYRVCALCGRRRLMPKGRAVCNGCMGVRQKV